MFISKYNAIKIGILLLIFKTDLAFSDCYYSSIYLSSESQTLNTMWYQQPQCHGKGFFLEVAYYTKNFSTIGINNNIKITNVLVKEHDMPNMEENVFNAEPFKSVRKLTYNNMKAQLVVKGALNGLESLQILHIKNAVVDTIEMGFLDALNNTLREFSFIEADLTEKGIKVDQFFGSEQLNKLENVTIKYKLEDLTRKSFSGLKNIKYLDLSHSRIESIGVGTFDSISESIEYLNLGGNHFTTVPSGLFDLMLQSNIKNIDIQSHQWTCDCNLLPLKKVILKYPNKFAAYVTCKQPIQFDHEFVFKADFCKLDTTTEISSSTFTEPTKKAFTDTSSTVFTKSTSEFTSEATLKTTSESTTESQLNQNVYCYSTKLTDTKDKPHSQNIVVKDLKNDYIIVYFDVLHKDSTLVWFSFDQERRYVSTSGRCSIGDRAHIVINNLRENSAYMFCIENGMERPNNCISYTKHMRSYLEDWLIGNSDLFAIVVIFFTFSLIILGLMALIRRTRQKTKYDSILASKGYASITSPFNKDLNKTYGAMAATTDDNCG